VLDMLAVKVTVTGWHTCQLCRGKGKLRGGKSGERCHGCLGGRQLPELNVTCWWAEDAYEALRRSAPAGEP
jgi:hypothetical protein